MFDEPQSLNKMRRNLEIVVCVIHYLFINELTGTKTLPKNLNFVSRKKKEEELTKVKYKFLCE